MVIVTDRRMRVGVCMRKRLKVLTGPEKAFLLGVVVLVGLVTLGYAGLALADQPGQSKVLTVDNPNVSCESPLAGTKTVTVPPATSPPATSPPTSTTSAVTTGVTTTP